MEDSRSGISTYGARYRRGKLFLENARNDQWRANIVIQLAESVGDTIDSLSGYIEMLLAIVGRDAHPDEVPTTEQAKYLGWLTELGALEQAPRS